MVPSDKKLFALFARLFGIFFLVFSGDRFVSKKDLTLLFGRVGGEQPLLERETISSHTPGVCLCVCFNA